MQYTNAAWRFEPYTGDTRGPAIRTRNSTANEIAESSRSNWYSQGATARTSIATDARLFLGTDRIWYTSNWKDDGANPNWVTIPSMTDPYASGLLTQDQLLENGVSDEILAIEIIKEGNVAANFRGTVLLVLCERSVRLFRFTAPDNIQPPVWTSLSQSIVSTASGVDRPKNKKISDDIPNPFVPYLPKLNGSSWTDIAGHAGAAGQETFMFLQPVG